MLPFFRTSTNFNLDPEELFDLYLELGTLKKVINNLTNRGIVSQKTGEPYKNWAISKKIWVWILQDYKSAYKILRKKGYNVSEEYWEQFCVSKAYSLFITVNRSREKYYAWIDANNLDPKYKKFRRQIPFKDL